jgi:hypothetical protein
VIAPPAVRPGAVTTAAVLAFVAGGLLLVFHLWALLALLAYARGGMAQVAGGSVVVMYGLLLCRAANGVLYLCGAVAAIRGRTRIILVVAATLHITFAVLVLITSIIGVRGARAYTFRRRCSSHWIWLPRCQSWCWHRCRPLGISSPSVGTAQVDPPRHLPPGFATATSVIPRANAPTTISGCHHCAPSQ